MIAIIIGLFVLLVIYVLLKIISSIFGDMDLEDLIIAIILFLIGIGVSYLIGSTIINTLK